jgi:signal transduction histidine kinase
MLHELRTPLNAIIGYSDLMMLNKLKGISDEKRVEYLKDINSSGTHLLSLIEDVLDLSKIASRKFELRNDACDLNAIIIASYAMVRPNISEKEQNYSNILQEDLPLLKADQRSIKQVLINLLSNANKYTDDKGEITISTYQNGSGNICTSIIDNGIGMTKREIETALKPFSQIHSPYTSSESGTGMGLSIASELLKLHKALLKIESTPNLGTKITIEFPVMRTVQA